jgi:hypothetical protein
MHAFIIYPFHLLFSPSRLFSNVVMGVISPPALEREIKVEAARARARARHRDHQLLYHEELCAPVCHRGNQRIISLPMGMSNSK